MRLDLPDLGPDVLSVFAGESPSPSPAMHSYGHPPGQPGQPPPSPPLMPRPLQPPNTVFLSSLFNMTSAVLYNKDLGNTFIADFTAAIDLFLKDEDQPGSVMVAFYGNSSAPNIQSLIQMAENGRSTSPPSLPNSPSHPPPSPTLSLPGSEGPRSLSAVSSFVLINDTVFNAVEQATAPKLQLVGGRRGLLVQKAQNEQIIVVFSISFNDPYQPVTSDDQYRVAST